MNRFSAWRAIAALAVCVVCFCGAGGLKAEPVPGLVSGTGPEASAVDFNKDRIVNFGDFVWLARSWLGGDVSVDVAPPPLGDGLVDFADLSTFTGFWLQTIPPPIYITWIGHASVKVAWKDIVIYVDPRTVSGTPHDATMILVTHSHSDHYAPADIAKVRKADTRFIGPPDVVKAYGSGQSMAPGQTIEIGPVRVLAVPSYNINKTNHPKANNWLGFIVEIAGKRIYCAGDTDLIPEMQTLGKIDVAFLPAGGTYTMNAVEAAEATKYVKPLLAIPYHWGEIVGTLADAQRFAKLAACNVKVMAKGEVLSSDDWQKDFSLAAWWKLDETQGTVADDGANNYDGTLTGGPIWQPAGGRLAGAIQLDGVDDYITTPFILNPSEGSFSLFAWVKGGAPGQAIFSQAAGVNWLMANAATGSLMTQLRQSGRDGKDLVSAKVITDGQWHRVGLTWDGTSRVLYVDDVEVGRDTQAGLLGSTGGLRIGAAATPAPGAFWAGLIDDVRLSSRAVAP